MSSARNPRNDPDRTLENSFLLGSADDTSPGRVQLTREDLLGRLTAMIQACEGCENVQVVEVTRLDWPDKNGVNWSRALVLDPAGVQPEVYALAYAQVIGAAHDTWNLK